MGISRRRFAALAAGGTMGWIAAAQVRRQSSPGGEAGKASRRLNRKDRSGGSSSDQDMSVKHEVFGKLRSGEEVELYSLANSGGMRVRVMTLGATLIGVDVPDRNGQCANVTLHLPTLADYDKGHPCFGSTCGRYANRIAKGKFTLDGVAYSLATNNGPNHLHGGKVGFHKHVWQAEPAQGKGFVGVLLTYVSADGEEGYPGKLTTKVQYSLTEDNRLSIDYTATADKPTVVNLTNHAYWNLAGRGDALGHELVIHADRYLPVDDTLIPLGELRPVQGSPMDFSTPHLIGSRIAQVEGGYDHCYVLNKKLGEDLSLAAHGGSAKRPRPGTVHDRTRSAALYGQRAEPEAARRSVLRQALRFLPGVPALPRRTQPAAFPLHGVAAGQGLQAAHGAQVQRRAVGDRPLLPRPRYSDR